MINIIMDYETSNAQLKEEPSKSKQDFNDIREILFNARLECTVSPVRGTITININHGSTRQLVLSESGTWELN